MLTFATKNLSTGAHVQKEDGILARRGGVWAVPVTGTADIKFLICHRLWWPMEREACKCRTRIVNSVRKALPNYRVVVLPTIAARAPGRTPRPRPHPVLGLQIGLAPLSPALFQQAEHHDRGPNNGPGPVSYRLRVVPGKLLLLQADSDYIGPRPRARPRGHGELLELLRIVWSRHWPAQGSTCRLSRAH